MPTASGLAALAILTGAAEERTVPRREAGVVLLPFAALVIACSALALPTLLPSAPLPLTGTAGDLAAMIGFGALIAFIGARTARCGRVSLAALGIKALLLVLAALVAAALCSAIFLGGPPRLITRQAGTVVIAAVALLAGARLMQRDASGALQHLLIVRALLLALMLAGAVNAVIAAMQYLVPGSTWVPMGADGRAFGHMLQPNHLATQLLWSLLALVALREIGRLPGWLFTSLGLLMITALAMTASRTGAVASLLPALWGLCDRRLSRSSRIALIAVPLLLALCWWALAANTATVGHAFAGTGLLQKADPTSSRLGVWQQSLRLIAQNPWFGVGWGQFGLAWTLTPMEPVARVSSYSFTHPHNLPLMWGVELGLPLTLALLGLIGFAAWRALQRVRAAEGAERVVRGAALVMVAVVSLHSQLEYPLWYASFLLPTACLCGLALGTGAGPAPRAWAKLPPTLAGGVIALVGVLVLYDYQAVANVFAPPPQDGLTTEQRMERARHSVLFGQFGDRFTGTLARPGQRQLAPYREVVFEQVDLRLLASWALAHAEQGQLDKARYLAARLKEFDHPIARQFFAVCATPKAVTAFQCMPPPPGLTFRDFR